MSYKSGVFMFAVFALYPAFGGLAQEKKEEPPPIVVKRAPAAQKDAVPSTDKYPLTEALRTLESGDA